MYSEQVLNHLNQEVPTPTRIVKEVFSTLTPLVKRQNN